MLAGSLDDWLPHFRSIEERVSDAIEAAWPVCIAPLQSKKNSMTHEDHITEHLVQSLIRTKTMPGRVIYQYTLLVEDDDGNVSMSSNIDFVLTVGDDEDVYLACECKRLNVPYNTGVRGLVGEYVNEGLMRFVTGQYSNGLPLAMMIGYVMNAQIDRARRGVKRAMAVRSTSIRLQSERDNPVVSGRPLRFYTTHACLPGHTIEVAHNLLAWP
ncbi:MULTISPECIES: hypothetical protein [Pseudomonas chlororaphis group]|uniref:hypothetical protein n=1 Tax=Pseudomonas chlororaphis group TaxID=136842 RepID=UPI002096AA45|nr:MULTISPECIES: hypothetical protein [Pseudomonas chlororaphis group]MCO7577805.1 hypothetical protein [Pseudomonas protegens]MCO7584180.1 hypothetical protein [Pseudomonas chlororaphis]MCO7601188.1 hypothetical protein [Pseudomonas chlororaphis]